MVHCIALASGLGAANHGCGKGPEYFHQHLTLKDEQLFWHDIVSAKEPKENRYDQLAHLNSKFAVTSYDLSVKEPFFFAFGGDHSSAIGTWSGVAEAKRKKGDIGLIWVDAHMDAHTPDTSETGNIHGMPLAHLLGYGDKRFTYILSELPKIKPENVFLIGIRSFEQGEADFLEKLNVRVYFMEEVRARGFKVVLEEVLKSLSCRTAGYGISFDLDAIDPSSVAAVGTPVPGGIPAEQALDAMALLADYPPVAFELVEYNPELDERLETFQFSKNLLQNVVSYIGAIK